MPTGNLLIPSAIVFTGGTYEASKQFSQALNMNFVNKDQFYKVQSNVIFPIINKAYNIQQDAVIDEIKKQDRAIDFCGDGRSDRPGHNAKYGTYTLMDECSENKELIVLSIKLSNEMLLLLSNYSLAYLKPTNSNSSSKPGGG